MSPTLDGICTVSQNVPSGLTVSMSVAKPRAGLEGAHGARAPTFFSKYDFLYKDIV